MTTNAQIKAALDQFNTKLDRALAQGEELKKMFTDIVTGEVVQVTPTPTPSTNFPAIGSAFVTPSGSHMTLKQADEMLGTMRGDIGKLYINQSLWRTTFWQGSSERRLGGNEEAQTYFDPDYAGMNPAFLPIAQRPNPFSFQNDPAGILDITASVLPQSSWNNWWMGTQVPIVSGCLVSMPDIHLGQPYFPTNRTTAAGRPGWLFQYGYVEARLKFPAHSGAWPAFWFLSDDTPDGWQFSAAEADYFGRINEVINQAAGHNYHRWPPEYDRIECFPGLRPTQIHDGYITVGSESGFGDWRNVAVDITQGFHTYGVEINAGNIIESMDGLVTNIFPTPGSWKVAGRRWYTILNLAMGGRWYRDELNSGQFSIAGITDVNGVPIAAGGAKSWTMDFAHLPCKMSVDYVRWYE